MELIDIGVTFVLSLEEYKKLAARLESQDKLIKQVLEFIDEINPRDWNDGCGCCGSSTLEHTDEWENLVDALKGLTNE